MNDVLWERYDPLDWMIDRLGGIEFLSDQMFGYGDRLQPAMGYEAWRNQYQPAYLMCVI